MNINVRLNEIGTEIARMVSHYKSGKLAKTKNSDDMICKLSKIESSFGILKEGIIKLESHNNFIEKIKIKRDLKNLLKLLHSEYSKEELKASIIKQAIDKLNVKYKLKELKIDQSNKLDPMPNTNNTEMDEEYYKDLQERIVKSHKKAEEKKNKNGIKCDEPVQTISISEIKEAAERASKIESAKEKKKLLQKQQSENIIYDVRRLENEPKEKISFFDKLKLRKNVKNTKRTSTVTEDRKKFPWYATVPVIGALAISAITGGAVAFNNRSDKNNKEFSSRNAGYSDSVNPSQTKVTKATEVTEASTTETTRLDKASSSLNTTKPNITTSSIDNTKKQSQTTTTPEKGDAKDDNTEKSIVINIGDRINVYDGLEYTADCLGGGNSNKIGEVSWRPATDYSVDKVAFCYNEKVLGVMSTGEGDVKQMLNNYATQYEIDANQINTSVLLSLVPGSGDTGWAQISIDDMEKNISKPIQNLDTGVQTYASFEIDR